MKSSEHEEEGSSRKAEFKDAHRAALMRLEENHRKEYADCKAKAKEERGKGEGWVWKARSLLREIFPKEFLVLYNEEKEKRGLPASKSERADLKKQVIALYADGTGLTKKDIAEQLGVSKSHVYRLLQPRKGKRDGNDNPGV